MRWVLTGRKRLSLEKLEDKAPLPEGFERLHVLYCGICRTDAKMWDEGHRDLVFPRVLGHELVTRDESGKRFVVWPGSVCGDCRYCRSGRENLCSDIEIMGFNRDGGFAKEVIVPDRSLIPVPGRVPSPLACFAEPVGCAVHALKTLRLQKNDRIIIYGGGPVGLMAALVCQAAGALPLVIEKNEEKIPKIGRFLRHAGIRCVKETTESDFDAALNACPDPVAFNLCTLKLGKGGRFAFFSGLKKNVELETDLINLMHYKEIEVHGAYGLTRADMAAGLEIISQNGPAFDRLIESVEPFHRAPELMPEILAGTSLKFILDFTVDGRNAYQDITAHPTL
jgi:threonine dehydrogenase-like Zn-dependent dehydrogenase